MDYQQKLTEYKALPSVNEPGGLEAHLAWVDANPAPNIPTVCRQCKMGYDHWQMDWGDVKFELEHNHPIPEQMWGFCGRCLPDKDRLEDEEEENARQ